MVNINPIEPKCQDLISCNDKDKERVNFPHSDFITIKTNVGRVETRRVLIGNGRSYDIPFLKVFMEMRSRHSNLKPCSDFLLGFSRHEAQLLGRLLIHLTLENGQQLR